jgi:hypothetical protein
MLKDILWTGPNIPCINLCKGDMITDVIFKIASEVCSIIDSLDLDTLNYECIIDKAKVYGKIDLYLFFSLLLKNDCDIKDLINIKLDELDQTELLVDNLDIKCFLQAYLDEKCTIVRFYNQPGSEVNPNDLNNTVFQKSQVKTKGVYYVSDINQSVWEWNGVVYEKNNVIDLNKSCICELSELDLDVPKVLQVIINNICQTKESGIIKINDPLYKTVPFSTIDPNTLSTIFDGTSNVESYYYISKITHNIWRWVSEENSYLPSLLTSSNINIQDITTVINSLEISYQNWVDAYNVYQEPLINSCLSSDSLSLSAHIIAVTDEAVCELKDDIGTEREVYYAHLSLGDNIVTFTGQVNGPNMVLTSTQIGPNPFYVNKAYPYPFIYNGVFFEPFKQNLAVTEKNQNVLLGNLINRLKTVETTCCTPTCDNTTIGFNYSYNEGIYTLVFDKSSGTNIDESFTDCGSIITVTDWKGLNLSFDIELSQNLIFELDVSSLNTNKELSVSIKSCFTNGTLNCSNCEAFTLPGVNDCGYCKLCAESSLEDDYVEVIYNTASESKNTTIKLLPGQCLTFSTPEDLPNIKSVYYSSKQIKLLNDEEHPCFDGNDPIIIPEPLSDTCWFFPLPTTSNPNVVTINSGFPNVISPGTSLDLNFNLIVNNVTLFDSSFFYNKLYTHINPQGLILTGVVDGMATPNQTTEGDSANWFNKVPDSIEDFGNSVKEVSLCSGAGYNVQWNTFGTSPIPNHFNANGNSRVFFTGYVNTGGSLTQSIRTDKSENNSSLKKGIILKLKNQPITAPIPEISLRDHINNNLVYVKGELIADDCGCPS